MRHGDCHPRLHGDRQIGKQLWKNCYRKSRQGVRRMAGPRSLEGKHGQTHHCVPGLKGAHPSHKRSSPPRNADPRETGLTEAEVGSWGQWTEPSAVSSPRAKWRRSLRVTLSVWAHSLLPWAPGETAASVLPPRGSANAFLWGETLGDEGAATKPKNMTPLKDQP